MTLQSAATNTTPPQAPPFDPREDYDWDARHELEEDLLRQELVRRLEIQERLRDNPELKAVALELAKRDFQTFCNDWVWTLDPRNAGKGLPTRLPFVLRPRQVELATWLEDRMSRRENGLVEKSRDEGLTWLMCAFCIHKWLFVPGFKAGIGSRKLDLVDQSDNPDCIFEKLRFVYYGLPDWMRPRGFRRREHDKYCRFNNPQNGASITGEGGDNIGRGGRNSIYFVDEHSKLDHAESVEQSLSQNTECIIYGGTPFGVGNLFYEKRQDPNTPHFTMHWMDNPSKNYSIDWHGQVVYPWYELQKAKFDAVTIAQEVDIDYTASISGILIPAKYIAAATQIQLRAEGPKQAGVDASDSVNDEGDWTTWGWRQGGVLMDVKQINADDMSAKADIIIHHTRDAGVQYLTYDRNGVGAAFRGPLENRKNLGFAARGLMMQSSPSGLFYPDDPNLRAKYRFRKRKDEVWWALWLRFKRTYEKLNGTQNHPDEDCISLARLRGHPDFRKMVTQLSQPTAELDSNGKYVVDKFGGGSKSPDYAEMIALAFYDEGRPDIMVVDKAEWM